MSLKKVAVECARHTSLKGVARMLKSDSAVSKCLWFFGVVLFLVVCGQQCYVILKEYFSYPVVTTISDKDVVFAGENVNPFPNIEVCNLSPFSSEAQNIDDILSVDEYLGLVEQARNESMNMTDPHPDFKMEEIFEILNSPEGYFNYLGYSKAKKLGHQPDIFIAKCSIIIYYGSAFYHQPCGNNVTMAVKVRRHFLQCIHLQIQETNYIYGISLVLYTDGFKDPFHFKDWDKYHIFETGIDRASGALIELFHPGAASFAQPIDAMYVNPGETTNIRFKYQTITRLDEPYGICNTTEPDERGRIYTRQACMGSCQAIKTIDRCNCIDTLATLFNERHEHQFSYCLSLRRGIEAVRSNVKCLYVEDNEDTHLEDCLGRCQVPCITYAYPATITSTKWPKPSQYKAFYKSIIANKSYAWRFAEMANDCHGEQSNCTQEQISQQQYLVDNHFAKVDILLGDLRQTLITDHPQISLSSLLAKLGGALNLWSGITVVIIIEFIDFILKLVVMKSETFANSKKINSEMSNEN